MTLPESISFSYEDSSEAKSSISVHDSNKFGILKYYMNTYAVDTYDMSSETYEYMNSNYRKNNPFIVREYENQRNADDMEYVSIHDLNDYISSWNGDFTCHIIGQNSTQSITSTKTYRPISLQLSKPNRVKYNFGYFMPRFYDIIEFDTNDYKLGKIINMSMLLGNTSVKKINELKSYTGNKVFSHNRNVIRNFFIRDSKSIFESNWDRNYYRHYNNDNDENDFDYLNGYVPGIEDKSFFGSKCFVYKNEFIELDDFSTTTTNNNHTIINSDYNVFSKNKKQYKLTINITQSIYNMLENDSVFKSNWNGLQASQITTSM